MRAFLRYSIFLAPFTLLTLPLNKEAHNSVEFMTEQRIIHQKRDEEKQIYLEILVKEILLGAIWCI